MKALDQLSQLAKDINTFKIISAFLMKKTNDLTNRLNQLAPKGWRYKFRPTERVFLTSQSW